MHGLGYAALALALGLWTLWRTLEATGGVLVPPLDDTFIYLQYARMAAEGHPLAYQPGAESTRGATSLIYPMLLAPFWKLAGPEGLLRAAWALGILCLALTALGVDRWAARRIGPAAAWGAGLLTLLCGHLVWGAASGMDIAVYALALAGTLAAVPWYQDATSPGRGLFRLAVLGLWILFLALARPEGMLLALGVALAVPLAGHAPNSRRARLVLLVAAGLGIAVNLGVNLAALGTTTANTLEAKAVWSEQRPDVREATVKRLPWVLKEISRALFSDFRSVGFRYGSGRVLELLIQIGAVFGALWALFWKRSGLAERTLVGMLCAGLLAGLIPAGFNSHHHRYQIPYVPLATVLVVLGWSRLLPARLPRAVRWAPLVAIGILLLPGLVRYVGAVGRNASNIHEHQVAAGLWIRDNLPENAIVGINDAGAIAYYGERPVVDLVGLVTNGSALPKRAGPACLFEWLESLPHPERPTHFAVFPEWFPYLRKTSLMDRNLTQFLLRDNTISGSDLKVIYSANWGNVDSGDHLQVRADLLDLWGFRIMDQVDVADMESERLHDYAAFPTWRGTLREFPLAGSPNTYLIDGGRQPTGGERFTLRCQPGLPAALVMRTEAFRPLTLHVFADGEPVGTLEIERASSVWTESVFQIMGDALTSETVTLELRLPEGAEPYPSFHYWLLQ